MNYEMGTYNDCHLACVDPCEIRLNDEEEKKKKEYE